MTPVLAVLVDCDGVAATTEGLALKSVTLTLKKHVESANLDEIAQAGLGMNPGGFWENVARTQKTNKSAAELTEIEWTEFMRLLRWQIKHHPHTVIFRETQALISDLVARGYRLGLVSSAFQEEIDLLRTSFPVLS